MGWRLRTAGLAGYTVTLKIKLADFRLLTRSRTCDVPVQLDEEMMEQIRYLAEEVSWREPVRLLGVAVSHLAPGGSLGLDLGAAERDRKRAQALDGLKQRFGESIIRKGGKARS